MNMKFLIIEKANVEIPIETWSKLLPLQFKYFDDLEKKKTIDISYHLIGHRGSMLIVNAGSDEELSKLISEDPLFFYTEREVYPLTTRETHKKYLRKLLQH